VKTNVFIGKFNDQTFHVVGRVGLAHPWKFIDTPLWGAPPRLRTTGLDESVATINPCNVHI